MRQPNIGYVVVVFRCEQAKQTLANITTAFIFEIYLQLHLDMQATKWPHIVSKLKKSSTTAQIKIQFKSNSHIAPN